MSLLKAIAAANKLKLETVDKVGCVGDLTGYIDTGSYAMNALLSGSIYGGFHSNKITALTGDSGVGKTYYLLQAMVGFLNSDPDAVCLVADCEGAITTSMLQSRGIDISRVSIEPVETIEQFRTLVLNVLDGYEKSTTKEQRKKPKLFIFLDSLGNLSTGKEMEDMKDGKGTRDMTKPGLIRGAFRALTINCSILNVPMIITNHVYDSIGCVVGGTLIRMSDGSLKEVQNVLVGDTVATLSGPKPVTDLFSGSFDEMIELTLESGSKVTVSPNHHFLTEDMEWIQADELRENNRIVFWTMQSSQQSVVLDSSQS